jgi:hypothetical protein
VFWLFSIKVKIENKVFLSNIIEDIITTFSFPIAGRTTDRIAGARPYIPELFFSTLFLSSDLSRKLIANRLQPYYLIKKQILPENIKP